MIQSVHDKFFQVQHSLLKDFVDEEAVHLTG